MTQSQTALEERVRNRILSNPDMLLEDADLMSALVSANERNHGRNVVDLRGVAMTRLEGRLDRLEDLHRTVISAAYDNLAGTHQVHRAILRMMDARDFETFLSDLGGEVADMLQVDTMRLVLETLETENDPALDRLGRVLSSAEPGFVTTYIDRGRDAPNRNVVLRRLPDGSAIFGRAVKSEACLRLDFGPGRMPGMLVMGSRDENRFTPQQGIDLLDFFAGCFERVMRTWLD
ncbi:DUF484 family protein [Aestuariibius sp. 2305UL40-4]|uniref:DUF484 family protein n=1 Tax=Aestuariibius violaceus TaxID=3234132 RepID=UPI00345E730F